MSDSKKTPRDRFEAAFKAARKGLSAFECWQAFVYMAAFDIAAPMGQAEPFADMAETARKQAGEKLADYAEMFDALCAMLCENPYQDALGDMFMRLGIGNDAGGQFFTPYHLAKLVAIGALDEERARSAIEDKGYVTVCEPACGAGANVVGACEDLSGYGIDWQRGALFDCQDVSELTALMCYLQLSLIGAAAVVRVGDTLRGEVKYSLTTPVFELDPLWTARRMKGGAA